MCVLVSLTIIDIDLKEFFSIGWQFLGSSLIMNCWTGFTGSGDENTRMISIVVPMYNEEENVETTIGQIQKVMNELKEEWELILVDDGSTDRTPCLIDKMGKSRKNVRAFRHPINYGVGRALKTGFEKARGEIIITGDADLSYGAEDIPRLVSTMRSKDFDLVLASPYMNKGTTQGVPFYRLAISRFGNAVLRLALRTDISCVTSIFRAYRKSMIEQLELNSDGKEIEPEIVANALAMGFSIGEIPAILKGREKGKSKFKLKKQVLAHLRFCLETRPMLIFAFVGIFFLSVAFLIGSYLLFLLFVLRRGIMRPLLTMSGVSFITGIQTLAFCFLADQITILRRELARVKRRFR